MTDIEQKALALVNDVTPYECVNTSDACHNHILKALCRAIEQHEAFRQEVSDAVEQRFNHNRAVYGRLERFIIAKPDPLVEAMQEWWDADGYADIETFRAAIEKRGGKIVWGEG